MRNNFVQGARRFIQWIRSDARTGIALDGTATLALVIYAMLLAAVLLTVAAALGWLARPVASLDAVPDYLRQSSLGFYDKSELRGAMVAFAALGLTLTVVMVAAARRLGAVRGAAPRPSAATAAFAVVLLFSSLPLPPYVIDEDHWYPFVAAATAIHHGQWPYFNGFDSGYGLLAPAAFALWTASFGLSSLSLSMLLAASNAACGVAAFHLLRRLSGSRPVALLGASVLMLHATHTLAVASTFRAPLQIMLGACFLWWSLRPQGRPITGGLLFGSIALWNPPFGIFSALGFVLAHGVAALSTWRNRALHLRATAAMVAGAALPLIFVWMAHRGIQATGSEILRGTASGSTLTLAGYGNIAQHFDAITLPALAMLALYLTWLLHRWQRRRAATARMLFVGASLVTALPYAVYATGRADASHHLVLYWALLPSIAILFWGFLRLLTLRRSAAPSAFSAGSRTPRSALLLAALFLTLFPFQRVADAMGEYSLRDEPARQRWYADCAAKRGCDPAAKPTLANAIRAARQPIAAADPTRTDARLMLACAQGIAIVSFVDAWIYTAGGCYSPLGLPTLALINTEDDLSRFIAMLEGREVLLMHESGGTYAAWRGDMLGTLRTRLMERGFRPLPGCGSISFLAREHAAAPAGICR